MRRIFRGAPGGASQFFSRLNVMTTISRSGVEGFTLIEIMVTLGIIGTLAAVASGVVPNLLSQARADGAVAETLNVLRVARDRAIGERRNIEVHFITPNHIQIVREEIVITGPPVTTVIADTYLQSSQKFLQFTGQGDTPDGFGGSGPVAFGATPVYMFTSEGTFVDSVGDVLNGTVFLGRPGDPYSARAITVFGPTALLNTYKWVGRWVE
jgi:prepilin-type N-terminal cleavage/methylation domain-containing protein